MITNMENLVIQNIGTKSVYCRSLSLQSINLCEKLEHNHPCKESQTKAIICSSGMSAISVCLNSLLNQNNDKVNLIMGNELYCDTPRLVKYLSKQYIFNQITFDVNDSNKLMSIFDTQAFNKTNILFVESASNPSGNIFDYKIIPQLRKKSKQLIVIVDNSWLTHVVFNPFNHDVDMVVASLTKYYSAGECIAGAIICKKKFYQRLFDYVRINGLHVSPIHCQIILDNFDSLSDRIIKTSAMTKIVALSLVSDNRINIRHASLLSDLSNVKAATYYNKIDGDTLYPSIISFSIPLGFHEAIAWMKSKQISYETSYGSSKTRFDCWPHIIDSNNTLCRLAIGYDDNVDRICQEVIL